MGKNDNIYGNSFDGVSDGTSDVSQKIVPRKYKKGNIFRVYVSTTKVDNLLLNRLKEIILDMGDSVLEFLGEDVNKESLSQITGRIDIADFVLFPYNIDNIAKTKSILWLRCQDCDMNDVCKKRQDSGSCQNLSYYEYNYSIKKEKPVLVILSEKDKKMCEVFAADEDAGKCKTIVYKDKEIEQIKQYYQQFCNNSQSLKGLFKNNVDKLLRVLNKCVQRRGDVQTIGEYVIKSDEMSANPGAEMHIITNELINYDFNTIPSLTIAMNTQRGVKYYYYCTEDQAQVIDKLKERIKAFYVKSFKARQEVVSWIRRTKYGWEFFKNWIETIKGYKRLSDIIESLLTGSLEQYTEAICAACEEECNKKGKSYKGYIPDLNTDLLELWLTGKDFSKRYDAVYAYIDIVSTLIEPLRMKKEVKQNKKVSDSIARLEALNNMSKLTRWQLSPEGYEVQLLEDEIVSLMNYFQHGEDSKKEIVSKEIKKWLSSNEGEELGNIVVDKVADEEQKNEWVGNIHFCKINDGMPYILGYNFTLFLNYSPSQTDRSVEAAWYTTCRNANDDSTSSGIDNLMLMVEIRSNDCLLAEIQEIYKDIIEHNENTLNELKNGQSNILKRLGIEF